MKTLIPLDRLVAFLFASLTAFLAISVALLHTHAFDWSYWGSRLTETNTTFNQAAEVVNKTTLELQTRAPQEFTAYTTALNEYRIAKDLQSAVPGDKHVAIWYISMALLVFFGWLAFFICLLLPDSKKTSKGVHQLAEN